jgi:hypothetical protein
VYVPLGVTVIVICVDVAVHVHPSTTVLLKLANTKVGVPAKPWLNVTDVEADMVAVPLFSVTKPALAAT